MTEEMIAGRNAVLEALTSGRPMNKIYLKNGLTGSAPGKILAAAKQLGVPVEIVKEERLNLLACLLYTSLPL